MNALRCGALGGRDGSAMAIGGNTTAVWWCASERSVPGMRRAQSRRGLCYWQATVVLSPLTQETKQLKMLRGEEEIQQQAAIHGHQKKNHIVYLEARQ